MTTLVLLEQNGWINTRKLFTRRKASIYCNAAHSNSDMNIDEAVSDIRPYQFEPLLGTASVVFNEESSDSDSDIDLDQQGNIRKTKID